MSLRDECLTQVAGAWAEDGRVAEARTLCEGVESFPWLHECPFLVVDRGDVRGSEARDVCRHIGPFRDHCLAHVLGRELEDARLPDAIGEEAQLFAELRTRVVAEGFGPQGPALQGLVDALAAARIAHRWDDRPFDVALCGTAETEQCARAWLRSIDDRLGPAGVQELCAGPVDGDRLSAAGGPTWTDDSVGFASRVLDEHCERVRHARTQRMVLPTPK